jgi:hypothetical protein
MDMVSNESRADNLFKLEQNKPEFINIDLGEFKRCSRSNIMVKDGMKPTS